MPACPGQLDIVLGHGGQVKLELYLPVGQVDIPFKAHSTDDQFSILQIDIDIGQVKLAFGQVKVEDHLPGGRQN